MPLYFELDGTFPNHEANPLKYENLRDLSQAVRNQRAEPRRGVRRRRGPRGLRRRARRAGRERPVDRADRRRAAGAPPGRSRDLRPALLARGGRARARGRRRPGARAGRPLLHEGDAAGEERDLRRRARRPLLLPGHLLRRLGDPGGDRDAEPPLEGGRQACRSWSAPLRRYAKTDGDQLRGRGQGRQDPRARRTLCRRRDRLPRRDHDRATPTWWANVRPSNTEPLLRLVLEADTEEEMERRKAELVALLGEPV